MCVWIILTPSIWFWRWDVTLADYLRGQPIADVLLRHPSRKQQLLTLSFIQVRLIQRVEFRTTGAPCKPSPEVFCRANWWFNQCHFAISGQRFAYLDPHIWRTNINKITITGIALEPPVDAYHELNAAKEQSLIQRWAAQTQQSCDLNQQWANSTWRNNPPQRLIPHSSHLIWRLNSIWSLVLLLGSC